MAGTGQEDTAAEGAARLMPLTLHPTGLASPAELVDLAAHAMICAMKSQAEAAALAE